MTIICMDRAFIESGPEWQIRHMLLETLKPENELRLSEEYPESERPYYVLSDPYNNYPRAPYGYITLSGASADLARAIEAEHPEWTPRQVLDEFDRLRDAA